MSDLFFYFFATILILASLTVILARNPLYNVLSLVLAIFCLSSLFILMEAYFVGMILILVYAGAVLVFFLFVVMCLNLNSPAITSSQQGRLKWLGGLMGTAFLVEFLLATKGYMVAQSMGPSTVRGNIEVIGRILFTDYLLPFELTSLLLLIAVFGIVSLAQGVFSTSNPVERA